MEMHVQVHTMCRPGTEVLSCRGRFRGSERVQGFYRGGAEQVKL